MRPIYVPLPDEAQQRLSELAARELREPKAQATLLILDGLRRAERLAAGDAPARRTGTASGSRR